VHCSRRQPQLAKGIPLRKRLGRRRALSTKEGIAMGPRTRNGFDIDILADTRKQLFYGKKGPGVGTADEVILRYPKKCFTKQRMLQRQS